MMSPKKVCTMFLRMARVPLRKGWVFLFKLKTSSTSMKRSRKGMLSESVLMKEIKVINIDATEPAHAASCY